MKQNIWFGLRAVMLAAILSSAPSTQAQQDLTAEKAQSRDQAPVSTNLTADVKVAEPSQLANKPSQGDAISLEANATKVGTRYLPSSSTLSSESVLAKIQAHPWANRKAATLYVRNIPVLTFLGGSAQDTEATKVGVKVSPASKESQSLASASTATDADSDNSIVATSSEADDPVSRAAKVAAMINQLTISEVDAGNITVHWVGNADTASDAAKQQYEIRVDGKPLIKLNENVVLAGQKQQSESSALQAANRLRRLVANAKPLTEVADKPKLKPQLTQQIALGPVRFSVNGMASWYGPGFHGNLSANGEIYNQYAMTAAHKTLPFGTRVKVTNVNNGRSVIVRINDRGPYVGDRVIDLSMGAAEVIGMMGSGVAPVRLDILN